jgi:hypothetical protein
MEISLIVKQGNRLERRMGVDNMVDLIISDTYRDGTLERLQDKIDNAGKLISKLIETLMLRNLLTDQEVKDILYVHGHDIMEVLREE